MTVQTPNGGNPNHDASATGLTSIFSMVNGQNFLSQLGLDGNDLTGDFLNSEMGGMLNGMLSGLAEVMSDSIGEILGNFGQGSGQVLSSLTATDGANPVLERLTGSVLSQPAPPPQAAPAETPPPPPPPSGQMIP